MEITELKYFLHVAIHQNMQKAAVELSISPSSLSKAVAKLEAELGIKLFSREGRNIKLTRHGSYLKSKAAEILQLETEVKNNIMGNANDFEVIFSGCEVLLSHFGVELTQKLKNSQPNMVINFQVENEDDLVRKIREHEVTCGFSTISPPKDFDRKKIANVMFGVYASELHPIWSYENTIQLEHILKYPFVVSEFPIFGKIERGHPSDGWKEDKHPRKKSYIVKNLKIMEQILKSGVALAYLPDYVGNQLNLKRLDIKDYPYHSRQNVFFFTANKNKHSWLEPMF